MSFSWPLGRLWKRERKRDICGGGDIFRGGGGWRKCVEGCGSEERLWLVKEGREIKEKEKGKRN